MAAPEENPIVFRLNGKESRWLDLFQMAGVVFGGGKEKNEFVLRIKVEVRVSKG
jgi:hypothetical protein